MAYGGGPPGPYFRPPGHGYMRHPYPFYDGPFGIPMAMNPQVLCVQQHLLCD